MSSPQNPRVAHLILAAGASSRMGKPKQLLLWKGATLIGHAITLSLQLHQVSTYVILGSYYDLILKEIGHHAINVIHNVDWKSGMGSSISCGIQHILKDKVSYDGVLITLVDQPLIDKDHLTSLISEFNKNQEAIIATAMKERIGVPAIFSSHYFEELSGLNEDFGARYIIKNYNDEIITIDGKGKTHDIDTAEDYKALFDS